MNIIIELAFGCIGVISLSIIKEAIKVVPRENSSFRNHLFYFWEVVMNEFVLTLIWGGSLFIIIFLVNYFWVLKRGYKNISKEKKKKRNKKLEDFIGFSILIPKFKLDVNKMNLNYVFILSSLINAFIISFVFVVIYSIPWDLPFQILLGFVLLFGLIYALYELLGRHLVKKGWKKDE